MSHLGFLSLTAVVHLVTMLWLIQILAICQDEDMREVSRGCGKKGDVEYDTWYIHTVLC